MLHEPACKCCWKMCHCLLWGSFKTHTHSLCVKRVVLNLKPIGAHSYHFACRGAIWWVSRPSKIRSTNLRPRLDLPTYLLHINSQLWFWRWRNDDYDKTAYVTDRVYVCMWVWYNPPAHTNVISQRGFPKLGYHPLGPYKATKTHTQKDRHRWRARGEVAF